MFIKIRKRRYLLLVCGIYCLAITTYGQIPIPQNSARSRAGQPVPSLKTASTTDKGNQLKFSSATVDIVLQDYAEKTGRTILQGPGLPKAMITLRSQKKLSSEEYLGAIESVLGMYGIALLKVGDNFLKVVPNAKARLEAMPIIAPIIADSGDGSNVVEVVENDQLISQMVSLRYIDVNEAQTAINLFKHPYGQIQLFERINSILITDTQSNINRMIEIIGYIDQPVEAREEPNIVMIKYAKAADIKKKLEEIIADQQAEQKKKGAPKAKSSGSPGFVRPTVPGVIRAKTPRTSTASAEILEMVERGIIRGKVKIVSDERTNMLIIITRPENMKFFNKIIQVLDVETAPDVGVRVFRLEYAEAKTVAGMLNDLIGAAKTKDDSKSTNTRSTSGSVALRNYIAKQNSVAQVAGASKVGELSKDNIKILADERTNALVIMASKNDLKTIEMIIKDMDMMLSQVLIESAIIDIKLSDSIATGVDWLQRSMIAYNQTDSGRSPVMAFGGKGGAGKIDLSNSKVVENSPIIAGMKYYTTFFDLNLDVVITAAAGDSSAKVVSMPVIATTDNTEAKITATDKIYVLDGTTRRNYGSDTSDYQNYSQQDVGLELTVTPHINDKKFVVMEIDQTMSEPGNSAGATSEQLAGLVSYSSRTLTATVAVKSGDTIVLGGQVRTTITDGTTGIPLLSRIPILGRLFSYKSKSNGRTETVVFLTPTVLDTPEDIMRETTRRKDATKTGDAWKKGWSSSKLATEPKNSGENSWNNGRKENKKNDINDDSEMITDPALMEFMLMQTNGNHNSEEVINKK